MTDTFQIAEGDIRFVDNFVPRLFDGTYTISVQRDTTDPGGKITDTGGTCTQDFTVSGPRFKLDPADIPRIFEARDRRAAGQTAPSKGLTLAEVHYPPPGPS